VTGRLPKSPERVSITFDFAGKYISEADVKSKFLELTEQSGGISLKEIG